MIGESAEGKEGVLPERGRFPGCKGQAGIWRGAGRGSGCSSPAQDGDAGAGPAPIKDRARSHPS